ncbi:DNA methyltransferase [Gardnerella pickettii]|nr:DNA methyltransferase [Gardnerella pickettii]
MIGMRFCNIPINTSEIPQTDLNIAEKNRSNLFTWNGQFSPQFVEAELTKYADKNYIVLDPFAGSGTTLYESARKNLLAYGIELNPSAYYMAKIYELVTADMVERNRLIKHIDKLVCKIKNTDNILNVLTDYAKSDDHYSVKNVLSTLIILMDIYKNEVTFELVVNKWGELKNTILELPFSNRPICVSNGDARKTSLKTDLVDLVLTSPPYINVFNYHQNYRKSVEALGYNVLEIAKSEFGANRKHRGNRFLTVIQYCIDIALSLKEASRICKDKARMIYVVGRESTVLGYSFCNSELIYRIGTEILGFEFDIRQERVFKNRYGHMIYEDILHFINKKNNSKDKNDIQSTARNIAVEMLLDRYNSIKNNKNAELILDAIHKSNHVNTSEVLLCEEHTAKK